MKGKNKGIKNGAYGRTPWNKNLTTETSLKLKNSIEKMRKKQIGKKLTNKTKKKMRLSAIKYINTTRGNCKPNIGKNEKQILDELELSLKYKIKRQYPICGYFVD